MRRKTLNTFIHAKTFFSKKLKKTVRNVLQFDRKNLFKGVKCLTYFVLDLECANRQISDHIDPYCKPPQKGVVYEQTVLGGAFMVKALSSHYPLPSFLSLPRALFFNDSITSEKAFWLRFFSMIRDAVHDVHFYERDVLSQNLDPPRFQDLCIEDRMRYLSATRCHFCQARFGDTRLNSQGKKYKVIKCIDHDHATPDKRLRYCVCGQCNMALFQSCFKNSRIFYAHNAIR